MFCPKCGMQMKDDAKFCPHCGYRVGTSEKKMPEHVGEYPGVPKAEPKKQAAPVRKAAGNGGGKGPKIFAVVLAVLIIAAVSAGSFLAYRIVSDRKQADVTAAPETEAEKPAPTTAAAAAKTTQAAAATTKAVETKAAAETTAAAAKTQTAAVPANSSQDDGNLPGNLICYARMVSTDHYLFIRNPSDQEKTYVMTKDGGQKAPYSDIFMKNMHALDGYIYFDRTSPGDTGGTEQDKNIYRVKEDGTGLQKLTDIRYGTEKDAWLSLDAIVGGKCYFSYQNGLEAHYRLARVGTDGSGFEDLFVVPTENCKAPMTVNLVNGKLYYQGKDGLNCFDPEAKTNTLVLPGFSADACTFYDNWIYYVTGQNQGTAPAVNWTAPDGSSSGTSFAPDADESWMQFLQLSIYNGKLFVLGKSEDSDNAAAGRLDVMALDGTDKKMLIDGADWFNISGGKIYYRLNGQPSIFGMDLEKLLATGDHTKADNREYLGAK